MKILVDVSRCPMARIYNKAPSQSLWPIRMSLWLDRDVTLPLMKSYPFVLRLRWSSPRGLEKVSVLTEPGRFGNKVPVLWTWKEVTFVVLPSSCFFSCHHWLCPGEISQWPNCKWKRDSSPGGCCLVTAPGRKPLADRCIPMKQHCLNWRLLLDYSCYFIYCWK